MSWCAFSCIFFFFFFKQKTAYEMLRSLVGSEMCIRDRYQRRVRGASVRDMASMFRTTMALAASVAMASPISQLGLSQLVFLDQHEDAKCLDGSPAAYYIRRSTAEPNASKWMLYFQGGGECVTEADCKNRTSTVLGSSRFFAPDADDKLREFVMQSPDPAVNPTFHSWNHVFIPYCSGDLHLGQQRQPNSWGVRFAGHHIAQAVLTDAGLSKASHVVMSGESAGGIAALAHADWAQDQLSAELVVAPVGGFYFSNDAPYHGTDPAPAAYVPWTYSDMKSYYDLWDAFVPAGCAAKHVDQPWSLSLIHI
eukprot:TRINITY_DN11087_c0_g1_i3.p1 TRINITY_DN11087_c0_g1~~TRINITY_DN11087_c0_g1_i3.p1  ORF type:complete len:309 (+),score=90.43 TRINITY_DN11087_c0_g1_i3:62-988(+)